MVCICIIALVGSLLGMKGYDLLDHHRFRSATRTFLHELQHWRGLSLIYRCDVSCFIRQEGSSFQVIWEPDFIPNNQKIPLSPQELSGVKKIQLDNRSISSFHFILYSSGSISSNETLSFFSKKDSPVSIDLAYPSALIQGLIKNKKKPIPPTHPDLIKELNKTHY